jgi:hypothetical protein
LTEVPVHQGPTDIRYQKIAGIVELLVPGRVFNPTLASSSLIADFAEACLEVDLLLISRKGSDGPDICSQGRHVRPRIAEIVIYNPHRNAFYTGGVAGADGALSDKASAGAIHSEIPPDATVCIVDDSDIALSHRSLFEPVGHKVKNLASRRARAMPP